MSDTVNAQLDEALNGLAVRSNRLKPRPFAEDRTRLYVAGKAKVKGRITEIVLRQEVNAEIRALGRVIPNFDGVGGVGYQCDDGNVVSVETRVEQLGNAV